MKITTRQITTAAAMIAVVILLSAPPLRLGYIPFVLGVAITVVHIPVIIGAIMQGPLVGLVVGLFFGLSSLMWAFVAPTGPGDFYFRNPLISVLPRIFIGLVAYLIYAALREPRAWKSIVALVGVLAIVGAGLGVAYGTHILPGYAEANALPVGEIVSTWQIIVLISTLVLVVVAVVGLLLARRRLAQDHWGEVLAISAAAVAGTLTNTVLVLCALGVFGDPPLPGGLLLAIGVTNGIPETVAAVIITVAVVAAWKQIEVGRKGARILIDD